MKKAAFESQPTTLTAPIKAEVWETATDFRVSVFIPVGTTGYSSGKILEGGSEGLSFPDFVEACNAAAQLVTRHQEMHLINGYPRELVSA